MGALRDDWAVYWFSLASRFAAMALFWTLDKPWDKLVVFEGTTLVILGAAMWFA